MVLDLRLPDMSGFDLLDQMRGDPSLIEIPVVVFTGKELTVDEETRLKLMAKSIVLKDVQSPERLLDETALFLHRVVTDLPSAMQAMLERLHGGNELLRGCTARTRISCAAPCSWWMTMRAISSR